MNDRPKESDWKRYRSLVDHLRDRYLKRKNAELVSELTHPEKTPTEQFWDTFEKMKKEAEVLDNCLGYHARSRMFMSMALMFRYGMIERKDLEGFSEDLIEQLEWILDEK